MRFQILRTAHPVGTTMPCDPVAFPSLAWNATENRYEIELETLHDLLNLGQHENAVVRVLATGGGAAADLPLLELGDPDDADDGRAPC